MTASTGAATAARALRASIRRMNDLDVWRIAIDPTNPDIIFAGTRPAALFRSIDGGRNWQKLPAEIVDECPNVGVPRVTALTVDPSDPQRHLGRHRSRRGAPQHRRRRQLEPHHRRIYDLDIHDIAVTVNGGTTVLTSTPGEIFASHDRGESWQGLGVRDQFSLRYCRHLAQKADDPETLFVATGNGAVGDAGAIQRSKNGGKSWEALSLPDEPNSPIWNFATHSADPGLVIACSHYGELYASPNAGDSWKKFAPRIHRDPRHRLDPELTRAGSVGI